MRTKLLRAAILASCSLWLGTVVQTRGAQSVPLVTTNTLWRYNQTGADLGTAWRVPDYDDTGAGWEGPGLPLFGFEGDEAQYAALGVYFQTRFPDPQSTNELGEPNFRTNYYFRAHFNMPDYPPSILAVTTLSTTNWFDDGVVYYLNGVELLRTNMPSGTITANTFSLPALTEPIQAVLSSPATNLRVGDNVLAVELHQNFPGSSDEVFGMTMTAILGASPVITTQPVGVTNVIGATNVLLSVGATGTAPLFYQWYSNDVAVVRATNATFVPVTAKTNTANFYVIVSNVLDRATSAVVTVAIVHDTFPPTLISAFAGPPLGTLASNQVQVTFNERLNSATAAARTNYSITVLGTMDSISVTAAQHSVSSSNVSVVRLSCTSDLAFGSNYALTVNHIADTNGNVILPNSQIGITFSGHLITNLFPMGQLWVWNEYGDDPGTDWKEVNFIASPPWRGPASGFFYFNYPPSPVCGSANPTPLGGFLQWVYYFRTHFNLPSKVPTSGTLRFTHLIDDAAIFYLNGAEIFRYNLAPGPVSASDSALTKIGFAACMTTNITTTNLVPGDNVLAVEVHQFLPDPDEDVIFGTATDFDYQLTSPLPPHLTAAKEPAGDTVLSWSSVANLTWALESAPALGTNAIWTLVTASSPYTNNSPSQQFFRLHTQ